MALPGGVLPGNALATASFEYNRGRNEHRTINVNAPRPGETDRPDPTRGNIFELQSVGRSIGKILRVTARQRLRMFTMSGNYILASELEDGDAQGVFNPPSNSWDLSADWGRGDDRRHELHATVNAQLPAGVFLTVTGTALSGQPYTVTTGRDDNGDTVSNDRPPGVPRYSATGPAFYSTNVNVSKVFYLRRGATAGAATGGAGQRLRERVQRAQPDEFQSDQRRAHLGTVRPADERRRPAGDRDRHAVPVLSATEHDNAVVAYRKEARRAEPPNARL